MKTWVKQCIGPMCLVSGLLFGEERVRYSVDDMTREPATVGSSLFVYGDCYSNELVNSLASYFLYYGTYRGDTGEGWALRITVDDRGKWSLVLFEPRGENRSGRASIRDIATREIHKDDVNLLYNIWVNLLLEVRYGPRTGFRARESTTHYISAPKGSIGNMSAISVNHDHNPAIVLLSEITDELRLYVLKPFSGRKRLPAELTAKIQQFGITALEQFRR